MPYLKYKSTKKARPLCVTLPLCTVTILCTTNLDLILILIRMPASESNRPVKNHLRCYHEMRCGTLFVLHPKKINTAPVTQSKNNLKHSQSSNIEYPATSQNARTKRTSSIYSWITSITGGKFRGKMITNISNWTLIIRVCPRMISPFESTIVSHTIRTGSILRWFHETTPSWYHRNRGSCISPQKVLQSFDNLVHHRVIVYLSADEVKSKGFCMFLLLHPFIKLQQNTSVRSVHSILWKLGFAKGHAKHITTIALPSVGDCLTARPCATDHLVLGWTREISEEH